MLFQKDKVKKTYKLILETWCYFSYHIPHEVLHHKCFDLKSKSWAIISRMFRVMFSTMLGNLKIHVWIQWVSNPSIVWALLVLYHCAISNSYGERHTRGEIYLSGIKKVQLEYIGQKNLGTQGRQIIMVTENIRNYDIFKGMKIFSEIFVCCLFTTYLRNSRWYMKLSFFYT